MKQVDRIEKKSEGRVLFDFGKDAFSQVTFELEGAGGETVDLSIGECLDKNGFIDRAPGGYRCFKTQKITLKPGRHSYGFQIPDHVSPYAEAVPQKCLPPAEAEGEIAPFRFAEVENYRGVAVAVRTAFFYDFDDSESDFHCSDETLNRLWEFCKYSMKATSVFGKFVDGERERLPYEGDAYINQLGWFCHSTRNGIARDTIDEFLFGHPTWPTEWRLLMPILVRDYILYTGDTSSLKRWYEPLKERLLPSHEGPDGLLVSGKEIRDIVDWPEPERDGYELKEVNFVPNAYYYDALLAVYEFGHDETFREKARRVRARLREIMLKNGRFVDTADTLHTALHTAVFALRFSIAEPAEKAELMRFIVSRGMKCSVYGAQFLLEACFANGGVKHGFDLLRSRDVRSWNNMLAKGATISMEAWDNSFKPNQDWNHAWGAAPANVIPRWIGGIRPTAPGFEEFIFDPEMGDLREFSLRQPTPKGPILAESDGKNAKITVPAGTRCVCCGSCLNAGTHDLKF